MYSVLTHLKKNRHCELKSFMKYSATKVTYYYKAIKTIPRGLFKIFN